MTFLFRLEENTPEKLNIAIQVDNAPFDVDEIGFRILNMNAGLPGVQVFPLVDGTFEEVTTGTGHVDTGSYYAYDNAGLEGWTPSSTEELGNWRIEWRWKNTPASAYQTLLEDFQIVAESIGGFDHLIISVADIRAAGVPLPSDTPAGPSDNEVLMAIYLWQSFIERACRQWFYPKELTLVVDGPESDTMHFGVPIISISEIEINMNREGDGTTLQSGDYRVYSSIRYPHDRQNPRIKLTGSYSDNRNIFTGGDGYGGKFIKGAQNQRIVGVFGCVEEDGGAPPLIKHALTKLVVEKLRRPIVPDEESGSITPPLVAGLVQEEWTDGHKIKYAVSGGETRDRAPGLSGITDDPEILTIIKMYKAPIGVATPNNASI
jgi:hypothetical protein